MIFNSSYQILAALLSKSSQLVGVWLGVKRFSTSVWHVFVSQPVQSIAYCVLYGTWVPNGCVDYIVCTAKWLIQISLDFRNRLVHKVLVSKETKLLSNLPWPSRKQPTIFFSSNSNLVSLTFFKSFCEHWSAGLRCFCLLNIAEQMFFVLFPQESLFCNARHSVHSLVSVIKVNCSLHVIKHLSTLCNNFSSGSILEECIQTVHVLIGEAKSIQLL